jgi:cytochrome c oxidase subunit 2
VSRRRAAALGPPLRVSLLALSAALVAGCYPDAVSREGRDIGNLYRLFFVGGCVVAAIVWGLATVALIRFRRRRGRESQPAQVEGSTRLEIVWTAIPLATVLVLFGATYLTLNTVEARAPDPGVEVRVTAFRWGWGFDYPDASGTVIARVSGDVNSATEPELVVPVDEAIHFTLEANDVVHAFFVPRLLFKRDMIPGRVNSFDVTIETAGTYSGACAEFCGLFHDRMPFALRAVSRAEFEAWLASQPRPAP